MQKSVKIYSRTRPQCVVKVVSAFEGKLKRMGETVAVVDSKVISWAWSSSPEVDEVVDGCVASSESRQLLLDAVVDVHAMSEGWGDYFGSLVGSHQFVASGKSQLNDSKVQG